MSLRCSLLGHEFGDSEIERDREERGNEVVISVVELERCTRCGETRTISENTEVTQRSRSDADSPTENDTEPATSQPEAVASNPTSKSRSGIRPRPENKNDLNSGINTGAAFDTEGSEIIEEDGTDDRDPGAWPEVADHEQRVSSDTAWPAVDGEDEGFDATTPDGRTEIEFGGGLTPQADQGAEILDASDSSAEGGDEPTFESVESVSVPDRTLETDRRTELFCPSCETSGLNGRDSLRAGDICPECHRGYLAEREG
jgi:hypothetical protein